MSLALRQKRYFNSSGSNDGAKDTDDTEDSQYSLYSSSDSDASPDRDPGSSASQDGREERGNNRTTGENGGDSPLASASSRDGHQENGSSTQLLATMESGSPENFSKLLPGKWITRSKERVRLVWFLLIPIVFLIYLAKKSGNFGSASQLAKQLVQETLLDEGLRVVKEFNSDRITTPPNVGHAGDGATAVMTPSSTSTAASSSSTECSPIKSDAITSIMGRRMSPQGVSQIMASHQHQQQAMAPRPRGRPPKSLQMADRLEAAYQEKLSQHIQQSFLASQAYSHALAAANGFSNRNMGPGNGHSASGLEQIMCQGKESHDSLNGRGNSFPSFDQSILTADSSPRDMVMRSKGANESDLDMITDLSVKQEQVSHGNGCSAIDTSR